MLLLPIFTKGSSISDAPLLEFSEALSSNQAYRDTLGAASDIEERPRSHSVSYTMPSGTKPPVGKLESLRMPHVPHTIVLAGYGMHAEPWLGAGSVAQLLSSFALRWIRI